VFRFRYNTDKFCFDQDTAYSQYGYVVQCGVTLPIQQMVLFTQLPDTLTLQFIQFDDFSLGQIHEHCVSAVDTENGGRWISTLQRQFEFDMEFVNLVLSFRRVSGVRIVENISLFASADSVSEVFFKINPTFYYILYSFLGVLICKN
jgi:hypothetical protein